MQPTESHRDRERRLTDVALAALGEHSSATFLATQPYEYATENCCYSHDMMTSRLVPLSTVPRHGII